MESGKKRAGIPFLRGRRRNTAQKPPQPSVLPQKGQAPKPSVLPQKGNAPKPQNL